MDSNSKNELDFSKVYEELWPEVYNFIYYKVQNAEEAEEFAQETFHKVYKQVKQNKVKESKLKSYTYTTARNLVYDKWRREGKRPKLINLEVLTQKGFEIADTKQAIDDNLLVKEALELLSSEDRTIIYLRIIEGYSIDDVAEKLNRPKGTIKVMQFRALQKLRRILKSGGYIDEKS